MTVHSPETILWISTSEDSQNFGTYHCRSTQSIREILSGATSFWNLTLTT